MAASKKMVTIVQTGSLYGNKPGMRENLLGLGLGRIGQKCEIEDTPSTRGMMTKVRHLIRTEEGK